MKKLFAEVLVGNKVDLEDKAVSSDAARQLANDLDIPYVECSAATGEGVEDIFKELFT